MKGFAVKSPQRTVRGLAEPDRPFQHSLEHRREVAWRRVDDLQHLGDRGFPRQRFVAFAPQLGNDLRRLGGWRSIVEDHAWGAPHPHGTAT